MNFFFFIVIIVVFSCVGAILSASEAAVTMASRLRLHQLEKKGYKNAGLLLSLQKQMNTLISTILLSNTCLFSAITALTANILGRIMGDWGVFVASFAIGTFVTLYLEVIPKVYAYQNPEKVGIFLSPMLKALKGCLHPITHLMDRIAYQTIKLLGVKSAPQSNTAEDLRGAIDLHIGGGNVVHERAMLRSILDLSRITVSEIMVHRKNILSFNVDLPNQELTHKILSTPYTRIPIWKDSPDNIIGAVNVKNLWRILREEGPVVNFASIISPPWFIPETSTLFAQLQLFKEKHRHQAFVVDEYGSMLGMVTLEDILEEIVGEIIDEHDVDLPGVRITSNGDYFIKGSVTLRDLHRQYEWNFGDDVPSTLAGLILREVRTIPDIGLIIKINGFTLKVLRKNNHQISLVGVIPPKQ